MTISPSQSAFSAAAKLNTTKLKRSPPFSMRFTDEERARLDRNKGVLSLAAYIRLKLFTTPDKQRSERKRLTRKHSTPSTELTALSHMLGGLGQSRLSSNLNQIAKAANMGTLPVTPELEAELLEACAAIQEMRTTLIEGLGVKAR